MSFHHSKVRGWLKFAKCAASTVLSGIIITIQRLVCYFDIRSTFSTFILLLLPSKYPSYRIEEFIY